MDPRPGLRVGLIGAGRMGAAIARHINELRTELCVHEPDQGRAGNVSALGVDVVSLPALWDRADIVLLALPGPEAVGTVLAKMLRAGNPRRIVVDLSTNAPDDARRFAGSCFAAGHGYLDAPMSGGVWGARDGTLTTMVGGDAADFERTLPVLSSFCRHIVHVGSTGKGCAAKLLHNMVGEIEVQAFAEAFCVGVRLGVDPSRLLECLSNGMAASPVLTKLFAEGVCRGESVNAPVDMAEKDQRLLLEMARTAGVELTWTGEVYERLRTMQSEGLGGQDVSKTLRLFERKHSVAVRFESR